jgi:hypothetical protein
MRTFTIKYDSKKHRVALTTFCPSDRSADDYSYRVCCGTYDKQNKWTGLSLDGEIPVPEMIRWAYRKGYLKFSMKGE